MAGRLTDMKKKEKDMLSAGRVRDLAEQAMRNDYITHTGFLSLSEQSLAVPETEKAGVPVCFYGGHEEADRKVLFFLPSYLDEETLVLQEAGGEGFIACLRIRVRGARFTKEIGHRDCLGALMHLGIGRDQVGDILLTQEGDCAYVYVLSQVADHITRDLVIVGRAHVDIDRVPLTACTVRPQRISVSGSIASVRIDSLVAMVFHISRSAAQELVSSEEVFADGRIITSASYVPAPGCRISVRGHGKFIYEGEEKKTRKGRIFVRADVFS